MWPVLSGEPALIRLDNMSVRNFAKTLDQIIAQTRVPGRHEAGVLHARGYSEYRCLECGFKTGGCDDDLMLQEWNDHLPHKDKVGNDILVGMEVVYVRLTKTSAELIVDKVAKLTEKMVFFENGHKTFPHKIVVPRDNR